ncbi:MAG: Stp1/IreP family PP2C-type Ser/Thr phosphatase [Eubacteriales bacterium]|jgi:serine/threonine protein phosphatase PrpC
MEYFGATHMGKVRKSNEDGFAILPLEQGRLLLILCDGMGGENAGEVASGLVIGEMQKKAAKALKNVQTLKDARSALRSILSTANKLIYERSGKNEELRGMGTTAVAAYLLGQEMLFINVGDSRGYLIREGKAQQVTTDHSLVEEMIRQGVLTREESRNYPGRNMITMAIGTDPAVLPDSYERILQPGDRVLLCSDGLTNMIEDERIAEIVEGAGSVQQAVEQLIEEANRNGGKDNITVILFAY